MYKKITCHTIILLLFVLHSKSQNYVFAQLKGSPLNTAGWNLQGAAKVTNVIGTGDSELLLVPNQANLSGAIFVNQPINLNMCSTWEADFDFRMWDGSGADGIAFCFLDVPPVGFVVGGGLGIPATANGLKICFDTYNNCSPPGGNVTYEMPKVEIRWGVGYSECSSQPTAVNEGGYLNFITSPAYAHAVITYNNGSITVSVNGKQLVTGFQQFNFTGYLGFTSSTGGQTNNQSIKNVVIYTQMPPSVAGTVNGAVCPGDTVKLGTANDTAYNYSWSPANGLSSTSISNPYTVASNTTGNVQYQKYFVQTSFASSSPGCQSEDSVLIQVNPSPLVDFTVPAVCLPNGSITIKNNTIINDGTQNQIAYTWTFSDGGTSNQISPQHNYTGSGNYSIALKAVSSKGCISDLSKNFTVDPQAKAAIMLPTAFCADTAVAFAGSAGGLAIQKWSWNFGDNAVDSIQNPSHTYTAANTYTVTLSAVTSQGCYTDTPSATITINPLPVAGFSESGLDCQNQILTFTDTSKPLAGTIAARNWIFDDGTTSSSNPATHSFQTYGSHYVILVVQNSKGCTGRPDTLTVPIDPLPVVSFGTPIICQGVTGVFIDSSTIVDNTENLFKYQWTFGDGATGTTKNPMHAYAAGNYTATLVVTSNNGCVDSAKRTFPVSGYPVVDFKILTTNFCGNLPLQLQDNSSVAFGMLDSLKIFWNIPAIPDSSVIDNPVAGTVYTHNYATFGYIASQQVSLVVQAFSSGGCFTQNSGNSILFASPKLAFSPIPTFCVNDNQPVLLNEAKDTTIFTGSGFYSGAGVNNGYFTPYYAGAGPHTITYTYTLVNGCTDSVEQTVNVAVQPTVSAGSPAVILQGGQIVLQGSASGGNGLTFLWNPGTSLSDPTALQPVATPANDTYYTLTATNNNGCYDTAGVLIKVLQYPVVPNAFSPNGDGINDTWQIAYLSSYPDCVVEVFNRYGQLIFRSQGYQTPWSGTYNGNPLPVGTYYYIITTSHIPKPLTGNVTILR